MKTSKLLALVGMLLLASCTKEEKPGILTFEERTDVKMSELMGNRSLIKLETRDDNLITDVYQSLLWNGRIYILDAFSPSKGVFAFGMNGKYIGRIGSVGQGPGQYIIPQQMAVDEANNRLLVLDVARNILLAYSLDTHQCIGEKQMAFRADFMKYLSPGKLIWYAGVNNRNDLPHQQLIQLTDTEGNPISQCVEPMDFLPRKGPYNVKNYFHTHGGDAFFHHPFSNDVYRYDAQADSASLVYSLAWEGMSFPTREYVSDNKEEIVDALERYGYILHHELLENSEKLLCYFGTEKDSYIGVYDKTARKGYYTKIAFIIDDLGVQKFYRPQSVYEDHFVGALYVENLEGISEGSILYPYSDGGKTVDAGNPIIVLYE